MNDIIVLIPAHNEEKTIEEVVTRCQMIGATPSVIDDGSTDKTYEIIERLNKERSIPILKHKENLGKGMALKTMFSVLKSINIKFEYVVIIDGDLQYDPFEIPKFIEALKTADYVIGQRNWSQVPFRNRLGNYVWIRTFNFLFGTDLKDTNCGFVAMRAEVMKKLEVSSGYIVDNDMLIQTLKMGYRVENVPVSVRYNHKRGLSGIRMVIGILIFIIIEKIKTMR